MPLELDELEVRDALEKIPARWSTIAAASYDVKSAKSISSTGILATSGGGEHGTEWGSAVHGMLQAALTHPDADLHALARAALVEQGLPMDLGAGCCRHCVFGDGF